MKRESTFFKQKYPDLASKMGTAYLLKELSHLLLDHVKKFLPGFKVIKSKLVLLSIPIAWVTIYYDNLCLINFPLL